MRTRIFMRLCTWSGLAVALLPVGTRRALHAQERQLEWPSIIIQAHLDSTGQLDVRERQVMRLTGDWNGGEREFNVGLRQNFWFRSLHRVDSATGRLIELQRGDLDNVDGWDLTDASTVRWRSRMPGDPPFDRTERTYELRFVYGGILVPSESDSTRLTLDHDFGFADRVGYVERISLDLTVDPAWEAAPGFTGRYVGDSLAPGEGFVITVPLRWTRAGLPPGVDRGAPRNVRYLLALAMLLPILPWIIRLVRRESALGRFAPLTDASAIDETWLRANVLHLPPEVVGATWDDSTGEAEVAATLARLVQEKKLSSEVKRVGRGIFGRDVLSLKLEVRRSELDGHARELVDALFIGRETTDTDFVRKHYKSTGFDPAGIIRKPLATLVAATPGTGTTIPKPSRWPSLILLLAGVVTLVASLITRPQDSPIAFAGLGALFGTYVFSIIAAAAWQKRVRALARGALWFALPLTVATLALLSMHTAGHFRAGAITLTALTLIWLAFTNSVVNQAMARQSAERIALRKRLAAAREFFRRELRKDAPALRDEWFAYLIAFGLGKHIDRWFRAFGGEASRVVSVASGGSPHSSSSSSGSSWTGFGGGGGFSGGGSSASFAAAVGGMAASVSAPSSSSSGGGGGGGGGSSGGGGGGGW